MSISAYNAGHACWVRHRYVFKQKKISLRGALASRFTVLESNVDPRSFLVEIREVRVGRLGMVE